MNESKLFVGNLPYTMTEDQLTAIFAEVGEVKEAAVITDRDTGRSKGFGFVTMASAELAQAAIKAVNNRDIEGRNLTVNVARPRE